jgi:hypothetical protein
MVTEIPTNQQESEMDRQQIENLTNSFLADVMSVLLRYRGMARTDADVPGAFEKRIEDVRLRYKNKFESLRFVEPGHTDLINETEAAVNNIADIEIAKAREQGFVEFNPLIVEMYRNEKIGSN